MMEYNWNWNGRNLRIGQKTLIMGILNVTPDSFSDGGQFTDADKALKQALRLVKEGADIIDIGGESTRPGSHPVSAEEEAARVLPVIRMIREYSDIPISVDTYKSAVARQALEAGADMINDISAAVFDPEMISVASRFGCPLVIMHIKGTPRDMQKDPRYENVLAEVKHFLAERLSVLGKSGIDKVIIDPGIGFGKRLEDNLNLLRHLDTFAGLGKPLLIGTSRKSFIGTLTGQPAENRLGGTIASNLYAVQKGAHIVRVHDVAAMHNALLTFQAIDGRV